MIKITKESLTQCANGTFTVVPGSEKVTVTFDTEEDRKRYAELISDGIEIVDGEDDD